MAEPGRSRAEGTAADDYLKSIYSHTEWQDTAITPSLLAGSLGVAPSTVTEMVKKLVARELVDHEPYRAVRLTETGVHHALTILRRHRLIETWLVQEMGYRWDEVHEEAEVLEHTMSDRLIATIDERLGHPLRDPHGDAIPSPDGRMHREPAIALLELTIGEQGTVVRVSDRDPTLLRALEAAGIAPGAIVRLDLIGEPAVAITCVERPCLITREAAAAVWVSPPV